MTNEWPKILLLSGILLLNPKFSESYGKDILPQKFQDFENYKQKSKFTVEKNKIFKCGPLKYNLKYKYYYPPKGKVLEIYLLSKKRKLKYASPIIYAFDKNQDGIFEREEYLKDDKPKKPDGLNGNENSIPKWEYFFKKYVKDI